jgi:hypothetical protein
MISLICRLFGHKLIPSVFRWRDEPGSKWEQADTQACQRCGFWKFR